MSLFEIEVQLIFSRPAKYIDSLIALIREKLQLPDGDVRARLANGWPAQ